MNKILSLTTMVSCAISGFAAEDVEMPRIFSDKMVFQQGARIPVWGWTAPGAEVSASFNGRSKTTVAGADGKWSLSFDPAPASATPQELKISCGDWNKVFKDVLVGEVWLCSGQSNMAFPLKSEENAKEEMPQASYPLIRLLDIPRKCLPDPQRSFAGEGWTECAPKTVGDFSAVAYFFGKKLFRELNTPVGLINCSWPGSLIEPWTPKEAFDAEIQRRIEKRSRDFANFTSADKKSVAETFAKGDFARRYYQDRLKNALPKDEEAEDFFFYYSFWTNEASMYNGMTNPIVPYAIKGVIWYQGEQNIKDADYSMKQRRLVDAWRRAWNEGEFPFYITQIAPQKNGVQPTFWIQQYDAVEKIKNSGIVSTVDIGDLNDAHPKNKKDVGERLARLALNKTYGKSGIVFSGPRFKGLKKAGSIIEVEFDDGGAPLSTKDGKAPDSFEIAGGDLKFCRADAIIKDSSVMLKSAEVEKPEHVRFAWTCERLPNFGNAEGLPAFPFNSALPAFRK